MYRKHSNDTVPVRAHNLIFALILFCHLKSKQTFLKSQGLGEKKKKCGGKSSEYLLEGAVTVHLAVTSGTWRTPRIVHLFSLLLKKLHTILSPRRSRENAFVGQGHCSTISAHSFFELAPRTVMKNTATSNLD